MKPLKTHFICMLAISLSLLSLQSIAVTISDNADIGNPELESTTVKYGKLIKRYAEGKIETDKGTYYTSNVDIIDHRPINNWYNLTEDAKVALYFKENRLLRVVIY